MVDGMMSLLNIKNSSLFNRSALVSTQLLSTFLVGVILLSACQPPSDNSQSAIVQADPTKENLNADLSFEINGDTITLSPDSILNVKSSRYQPSLGLQGKIEPANQSQFVTKKAVTVQKVLVQKGQQVEKGSPLFILQYDPAKQNNLAVATKQSIAAKQASEQTNSERLEANEKTPPTTLSVQNDTNINTNTNIDNDNDTARLNSSNPKSDDSSLDFSLDSSSDSLSSSKKSTTVPTTSTAKIITITVRASAAGQVNELAVANGEQLKAGTRLLALGDDAHLQFIATLPIQAEPQLSIGQTVNFTTQDNDQKYTGQISKLSPSARPDELRVHVQVLKNDVSRQGGLAPNSIVTGRVDYGQIAVGTVVPEGAIHDADVTALKKPPYQPLSALSANVWIIKQDQRLTRQPVEVIEYNPITKQYLIAGVNNDSLICLADLPIESAGKKVVIS